jgi:CHAT domain-containing protein/HEAT repeat protein
MVEDSLVPFLPQGEAPALTGTLQDRPVLSPGHPWVAFRTTNDKKSTLWIADYRKEEILCAHETSARPVVFGPDGTRLLAEGEGHLWVFQEPWDTPLKIPHEGPSDYAWIDSETVVAAGKVVVAVDNPFSPERTIPSVTLVSISQQTQQSVDVADRWKDIETELQAVACSQSGTVVALEKMVFKSTEFKPIFRLAAFSVSDPGRVIEGSEFEGGALGFAYVFSDDGLNVLVVDHFGAIARFRLDYPRGILKAAGEWSTEGGAPFAGFACGGGVLLIRTWNLRNTDQRTIRVFKLNDDCEFLYSDSLQETGPMSSIVELEGVTRFAAGNGNRVRVFGLNDPDLVNLASEETERAIAAVRRVGQRRLPRARKRLEDLTGHREPQLRHAAVESLGMIAAPESAPALVRLLGHREPSVDPSAVRAAIDRVDRSHLARALPEALRGRAPDRRGAVRYLREQPYAEALDGLHVCLTDLDPETRQGAADALGQLADIRAVLPLLGAFGDENAAVREAAARSLTKTLLARGLLTPQVTAGLEDSIDLLGFATHVVGDGRLPELNEAFTSPVANYLIALSRCIEVDRSLDELRNTIERLTTPRGDLPGRAAKAVGLAVTLVFAEDLRSRERWAAALSTYAYAAVLAEEAQAPNLLWRCQKALGECHESLKQDREAAETYGRAMETIDRLWFALLEEETLRGFFAEKAELYEQAALCNLRLGHAALALECLEKAKTRYLGDLIARRQKRPRTALARQVSSLWRLVDDQTPKRVSVAALNAHTERAVITRVTRAETPATHVTMRPESLVKLEESTDAEGVSVRRPTWAIKALWNLASDLMAMEVLPDEQAQLLSNLYESLQKLRLAARAGDLPFPTDELGPWTEGLRKAINLLLKEGGEVGFLYDLAPTLEEWASARTELDECRVSLDAMLEPLDLALGRELVRGRPVLDGFDGPNAVQGFRFEYATIATEQSGLSFRTLAVQRALEQVSTGRWQYVSRVARGETATFQRSVDLLRPRTAQVNFAVTKKGTVAYVAFADPGKGVSRAAFPGPAEHLEVLSMPALTLDAFRARLIENPNGWFRRYREVVERKRSFRDWFEVMDSTLAWLSNELWMPVHEVLATHDVERVRIIPHRVLHLIPFAALPVARRLGRVRRLVDVFHLHTAPSFTLYDICDERTKGVARSHRFTAVCDPTTDLPFSAIEFRDQVARLPVGSHQVLKRNEATLQGLRALELGTHFHFAGHAGYNWADPLDSSLVFRDGKLSLEDLFADSFSVHGLDLVVLSACETSMVEPEDPADEWLGLASGFLFGGARSVISTLWAVNDLASALLLPKFYEFQLAEGLAADHALARAQRWLRGEATQQFAAEAIDGAIAELRAAKEQVEGAEAQQAVDRRIDELHWAKAGLPSRGRRPFAHPFYWAGFTLSGAVEASPSSLSPSWRAVDRSLFGRKLLSRLRRGVPSHRR